MSSRSDVLQKLSDARARIIAEVDRTGASIDRREAMVDAWILSAAMWLIDKPWTARLVSGIGALLVLFVVFQIFHALLQFALA